MNTPKASGRNFLVLRGKVTSGEGNGKRYMALPWVMSQMKKNLGYTPYLGTLNLTLDPESKQRRALLENATWVQICPSEGYCAGLIFKASIGELDCAIVLPQVKGYPENLLEVIAPVNLRETFSLKDGDPVTVTVKL